MAQTLEPAEAAIDRVLSGVDARLLRQHRIDLRAGEPVAIPGGAVALVYVICGSLRAEPSGRAAVSEHGVPGSLEAGDALLFTDPRAVLLHAAEDAFVLVSSLDLPPTDDGILGLLPPSLFVRDLPGSDPAVAALAAQLGPKLGSGDDPCADQPGSSVVCRMMANTVLVSVIRAWAIRGCAPAGWPSRTGDPFLDRVVEAVHADPAREWTLEDLARTGAMSRSVFAERFRTTLGVSPASYVAEVRIRSAQDLLAQGRGVSEVSRAIGYGSDEGFSRAFRRRTGLTPSAWRSDALLRASRV